MLFVKRHVHDQYKTQEMCNKVILQNGWTLNFVPDSYKNQKMWDKAVDNYAHTLEFVTKCNKTREMENVIKLLILVLSYVILFLPIYDSRNVW